MTSCGVRGQKMLLLAPVFEYIPGQRSFWYTKVFLFGASDRELATSWVPVFVCQ